MTMVYRSFALLLLAAALLGCTKTSLQEATGKGVIRGINGVVDAADAIFLIEEVSLGQIPYKSATSPREYDNLDYIFNFDLPVPNQPEPERIASRFVDVIEDTDYTFVLAGSTADPEIVLWERPVREWEESDTVFEAGFGHVNTTLGPLDVYFAEPGTAPVLGQQVGSLDYGQNIVDREFAPGDYALILTAVNDPDTVLFAGSTITLEAATSFTVVVLDSDPGITGPVAVRAFDLDGNSIEISDSRFPPTAQFVHAGFGAGNIDVVIDGDFDDPAVTNLAFGTVSEDADIPPGPVTYSFTPAGNTMPLFEEDIGVFLGSRSMAIVLGEPTDLRALVLPSLRRGISTVSQYRLTNASFNNLTVDLYFADPGESIEDIPPSIRGLPFALSTGVTPQFAQEFEVYATVEGEKTVLAGPVSIMFETNDVVEMVLLDTADPNVAELLVFSNLEPAP